MHVITEAEYDDAVQQTAEKVFNTDSPDDDVREWSEEIAERVKETEGDRDARDELRDETRDRVWNKAVFHHPWQDQEREIGFDTLPLAMHGMVLEHSPQAKRPDSAFRERVNLGSNRPDVMLEDGSMAVWASDVASAVFEDIRDHMKDGDS